MQITDNSYIICNMKEKRSPSFFTFLLLAIFALLFALWAGLLRLGWILPAFANLAQAHGPLMISGFLGVLIPLERAVAIRQKWMFIVPALAGIGWIGLLIQPGFGAFTLTMSSLGAFAILLVMVKREASPHTLTMAVGTLAWVIGNSFWLFGKPIFQIVLWWAVFLVLTIGGERLELNRVRRLSSSQRGAFVTFSSMLFIGAILSALNLKWGSRLSGVAMLLLAGWFLRYDVASHNLRHPNSLTRFIAICLFSGFIWLAISGWMFLVYGTLAAGPIYDAALHALFVGFVIGMIFGHAPIIFPAILGLPLSFSPVFYIPLTLLHSSLALRVIGDVTYQITLRKWGGLLNEVALLFFLGVTVFSLTRGKKL